MLDNARDADQVRPLLPGARGCLVLVTSSNRLTSLIAAEGARPLLLDLLTPDEARDLLACRIGRARVTAEPDAVDELIAGCSRLPLALAIVTANATFDPHLSLASLAGQLRDTRGRLDVLATGDTAATDVRAVFSWSYEALTDASARLFRLLGLHPGPDVSIAAAASLAALPIDQVRPLLNELAAAHLVTQHAAGRYTMHDLLRTYAAGLAHAVDTEHVRRGATRRTLDHYLNTAYAADRLLDPTRDAISLAPPEPGTMPEGLPGASRPSNGSSPNTRYSSPPSTLPRPPDSTPAPGNWPGLCTTSSTCAGTGTTRPTSSAPPYPRPAGWPTQRPRPGPTVASQTPTPGWATFTTPTPSYSSAST
ncbi:MAG: hypothetical protein ACRDP9_19840 [Kribbellaceae bacterium]